MLCRLFCSFLMEQLLIIVIVIFDLISCHVSICKQQVQLKRIALQLVGVGCPVAMDGSEWKRQFRGTAAYSLPAFVFSFRLKEQNSKAGKNTDCRRTLCAHQCGESDIQSSAAIMCVLIVLKTVMQSGPDRQNSMPCKKLKNVSYLTQNLNSLIHMI